MAQLLVPSGDGAAAAGQCRRQGAERSGGDRGRGDPGWAGGRTWRDAGERAGVGRRCRPAAEQQSHLAGGGRAGTERRDEEGIAERALTRARFLGASSPVRKGAGLLGVRHHCGGVQRRVYDARRVGQALHAKGAEAGVGAAGLSCWAGPCTSSCCKCIPDAAF